MVGEGIRQHNVDPPLFFCWGGWTSYQIFKKGGLARPQLQNTDIEGGDCLKRGVWTGCRFKWRGGLAEKRGWCFWGGGGLIPWCTLWAVRTIFISLNLAIILSCTTQMPQPVWCVCVCMSIHHKGFICLDQLENQGTDQQCSVEEVYFICQVPSSLLKNEAPNLSN